MASELCLNCFSVKGQYEVCPYCGYVEGTPASQPHYLAPGTVLGNHFIVGTVIGAGGFGITYKCYDLTLGVIVAIKEFYPIGLVNRAPGEKNVGLLSGDKKNQYTKQLKRFLMEAQSVAQFGKAKDIVNVYDYFEENNTAYIIMEYIDGVLLKDYLNKQGAMKSEAALRVILPIIEAVKKIHSKGIVHRDISPDNIFLTNDGSVKIFDFGAAQLNNSGEGMSAEKVIKVGYSAPEQYREKSRQGYFTDVYSVGAILYQMLTGVLPVESTEREYRDELKSPRELGFEVNSNIDRAVMEAMAVNPELRFQGIQHFEDALNNKRMAEYPKDKIKKKKRRRNWTIGLGAAVVSVIGAGIGLYSTVLKPTNVIFDTVLQKDTITIWVENEDQEQQLNDLVNNVFKTSKGNETVSENIRRMQSEDDNITVKVEVHEDMEQDLQAAKKKELPNMFLSDHVNDISAYDPVSFEENVYAAIESKNYAGMEVYPEYFPNMDEMPTGVDSLHLYATNIEYNKDNSLAERSAYTTSEYMEENSGGTVEFESLLPQQYQYTATVDGSVVLNNMLASYQEEAMAQVLALQSESWQNFFETKGTPKKEEFVDLVTMQSFQNFLRKNGEKYTLNRAKNTGIYGNNILAGVGFRKTLETLPTVEKGANRLKDYESYIVTADHKMLMEYSERYVVVGKASSENQQEACERLLWFLLSDAGQSMKCEMSKTTYPILLSALNEFSDYNSGFDVFYGNYIEGRDLVIIGRQSAKMHAFVKGIGNMETEDELQTYAADFGKGKDK